jgi:hypothetical protein
MEKRKLNFLLKNQFIKRTDVSKCLDKYQYLSWIKDFKNDKFIEVYRYKKIYKYYKILKFKFTYSRLLRRWRIWELMRMTHF